LFPVRKESGLFVGGFQFVFDFRTIRNFFGLIGHSAPVDD
jgi:hypothetical protein